MEKKEKLKYIQEIYKIMKIDTSILEDIGLTNAQIKIYLSLLELGETTSGPIIKKSKLQNSVVYNALNQLINHGLVTYIQKGKRKHFSTTDPKNLIQFIQDKKERVEELVPKLIQKRNFIPEKQEAQVFKGWKGLYTAFNYCMDTLATGSDYIGFPPGYEKDDSEECKQFFRELQKKRSQKKYKVKFIINKKFKNQVKEYNYYSKFGKPQFKFLSATPIGIIILGENILNFTLKPEPVAVIITSKQISDSYKEFFYEMWKQAEK